MLNCCFKFETHSKVRLFSVFLNNLTRMVFLFFSTTQLFKSYLLAISTVTNFSRCSLHRINKFTRHLHYVSKPSNVCLWRRRPHTSNKPHDVFTHCSHSVKLDAPVTECPLLSSSESCTECSSQKPLITFTLSLAQTVHRVLRWVVCDQIRVRNTGQSGAQRAFCSTRTY